MTKSILIVDDEEDVRSLLVQKFERSGWNVIEGKSGYEAMDVIQSQDIGLVISDYRMKYGDGISLAHFCSNRKIPCAVVTGCGSAVVRPYLPEDVRVFDKIACFDDELFESYVRDIMGSKDAATDASWSLKVLVVEDSEEDFEIISRYLKKIKSPQYELTFCDNFEVALVHMVSNRFDAYLVDQRLGAENGIDILRLARERGCSKPLLIVTGLSSEKVDHQAMLSGADDFVQKDSLSAESMDRAIRYAVERRRQNQLISDQQQKLGHTLRLSAVGQMTGMIMHELKNPLTIAKARAERLLHSTENKTLDPKIMSDVDSIYKAVERMHTIINGLQAFSRASSNDFEKVSLRGVLEEALSLCRPQLAQYGVEIDVSEVPATVQLECTPPELVHLFLNLFLNAVDAIEKLEDRWVKVAVEAGEDGPITIRVIDSGKGIPEQLRKTIFKSYFTTKAKGRGTGLGLSICKMIVDKHGGSMEVDATFDNTCFKITIPRLIGERVQTGNVQRILVVDDDFDFVNLVVSHLKQLGSQIQVLSATDAKTGLELMKEQRVDVVVSDVVMPGMNGVEFFKQTLAGQGSHLPNFIFMTGYDEKQIPSEIRGKALGLLRKPFDIDHLVDLLKQGVDSDHLVKEV